jgi:hypothetical protein
MFALNYKPALFFTETAREIYFSGHHTGWKKLMMSYTSLIKLTASYAGT